MSRLPSLKEGDCYGKLTVLRRVANKNNRTHYLFLCACGNTVESRGSAVKSGNTTSCGCHKEDILRTAPERLKLINTKHGNSGKLIYHRWKAMIDRCLNPKNPSYSNYGGRGITVTDRWLNYDIFIEDMGLPEKGMTLERVDNEKGYSKDNCIWASRKKQNINTRKTIWINFNGQNKPLKTWCEELGIDYHRTWQRLYRLNESVEKAFRK